MELALPQPNAHTAMRARRTPPPTICNVLQLTHAKLDNIVELPLVFALVQTDVPTVIVLNLLVTHAMVPAEDNVRPLKFVLVEEWEILEVMEIVSELANIPLVML